MLIDCDSCQMRDIACADCVVGALISDIAAPAPDPAEIGEPERRALRTLASAGLVPPLRLVTPDPGRTAARGEQPGFPDAEAS